jgi:hypothetical protein
MQARAVFAGVRDFAVGGVYGGLAGLAIGFSFVLNEFSIIASKIAFKQYRVIRSYELPIQSFIQKYMERCSKSDSEKQCKELKPLCFESALPQQEASSGDGILTVVRPLDSFYYRAHLRESASLADRFFKQLKETGHDNFFLKPNDMTEENFSFLLDTTLSIGNFSLLAPYLQEAWNQIECGPQLFQLCSEVCKEVVAPAGFFNDYGVQMLQQMAAKVIPRAAEDLLAGPMLTTVVTFHFLKMLAEKFLDREDREEIDQKAFIIDALGGPALTLYFAALFNIHNLSFFTPGFVGQAIILYGVHKVALSVFQRISDKMLRPFGLVR